MIFARERERKVLLSEESRTEELSAGVVAPTPSEGQREAGEESERGPMA